MKIIAFSLLFVAFTFSALTQDAEIGKSIPSVSITNAEGKSVNTAQIGNGKPMVISFWATWCSPCKRELNTIHDVYQDWVSETGVQLVAVSVDDQKTADKVFVYSDAQQWEYLVLSDINGDFKRAMGVNNVPHTFLVDQNGKIVYSHNSYSPGDEELLYQEILKLSK
jgi:peroxiredoxin